MTESDSQFTAESETAQAIEELRGEVSLTRRALEGLTAERERLPDYSPTLGTISQSVAKALAHLDRVERSPAISLSPDAMAGELLKAGAVARSEDARLLQAARDTLSQSIGRIDGIVQRGQAADRQLTARIYWGVGGLFAGMLIWAILPGAVARSLPASWHVPEWMAARTIGVNRREAGERMIGNAADGLGGDR